MNTPPKPEQFSVSLSGSWRLRSSSARWSSDSSRRLAKGPLGEEEIQKRCGLHPRGVRDFLDTLVALTMLERRDELYSNTAETDFYLDSHKPTYIGNYVE